MPNWERTKTVENICHHEVAKRVRLYNQNTRKKNKIKKLEKQEIKELKMSKIKRLFSKIKKLWILLNQNESQ